MPSRYLKESICVSPDIDRLSSDAETLFYRLIVSCDDFGRFYASPGIVASRCFPRRRSLKDARVARWLTELIQAGLIEVYLSDDEPFLLMPSWTKYQGQPRSKESKFPEPTDIRLGDLGQMHADVCTCGQMHADADKCPRSSVFGVRSSKSVVRSSNSQSGAAELLAPDRFNEFWNAYPRRIGKSDARRAWNKRISDGTSPEELIAGATRYAGWVAAGGVESMRYVCHPSTWLNQGREADELPPVEAMRERPKGVAAVDSVFDAARRLTS